MSFPPSNSSSKKPAPRSAKEKDAFLSEILKKNADNLLSDTSTLPASSFQAFAQSPTYKAIIDHESSRSKNHGPARKSVASNTITMLPLPSNLMLGSTRPLATTTALITDTIKYGHQSPVSSPTHEKSKVENKSLINIPLRADPPSEMRCPPRQFNTVKPLETNSIRLQIADYSLLASACSRGKRVKGEANHTFCIGVLYDNLCDFSSAKQEYLTYLRLSKECEDSQGIYLAYNALGVSSMLLPNGYEEAIEYHKKHATSSSSIDRFIAHTNLGLCYYGLNEKSRAANEHQHALRLAIRMGSLPMQSVAIGNLGNCSKDNVAKACMERYLEMSSADASALTNAHTLLGTIAQEQGDFKNATEHFHSAMKTAQSTGNKALEAQSKVKLGVALGNTLMEQHMKKMQDLFATTSP